jgi:hypothetical protein
VATPTEFPKGFCIDRAGALAAVDGGDNHIRNGVDEMSGFLPHFDPGLRPLRGWGSFL